MFAKPQTPFDTVLRQNQLRVLKKSKEHMLVAIANRNLPAMTRPQSIPATYLVLPRAILS